ncbi:hypothetical protein CEXT_250861 [Caerostris extrusa]|uniref:Uncharacterized protein n=1 Tax=Caerostris extrusa TaxID=172846 RepID=A0AAV4TCY5_CAEEX|nr:hypothetical protein CEXT_250861 [Caerostris extrusa]
MKRIVFIGVSRHGPKLSPENAGQIENEISVQYNYRRPHNFRCIMKLRCCLMWGQDNLLRQIPSIRANVAIFLASLLFCDCGMQTIRGYWLANSPVRTEFAR